MKGALVILVAAVLLSGCGQAQKDPFVGTWQACTTAGPKEALVVIANVSNGYHVALAYSPARGMTTLARHGNRLAGTLTLAGGKRVYVVIDYLPATRRLSLRTTKSNPVELTKLADTTAIPTLPVVPTPV
jgi:hypothetical protein